MLSKANRLSLKTDRFRVEKDARTKHSSLFTYLIAPRVEPSSPTRFAVLISKKNVPLSVDRHRLKRQLTEIIRLHLAQLPVALDIILIPKRNFIFTDPQPVLMDLLQTLNSL